MTSASAIATTDSEPQLVLQAVSHKAPHALRPPCALISVIIIPDSTPELSGRRNLARNDREFCVRSICFHSCRVFLTHSKILRHGADCLLSLLTEACYGFLSPLKITPPYHRGDSYTNNRMLSHFLVAKLVRRSHQLTTSGNKSEFSEEATCIRSSGKQEDSLSNTSPPHSRRTISCLPFSATTNGVVICQATTITWHQEAQWECTENGCLRGGFEHLCNKQLLKPPLSIKLLIFPWIAHHHRQSGWWMLPH
jgi:hypothetical protein